MNLLKKTGLKRFVLTVLLTGILVYAFSMLYMGTIQNDLARIDITNIGGKDNAIVFLSDVEHQEPNWCKKNNGSCSVLTIKILPFWKKYNVKFKALGTGTIQINLLGPYKIDKDNKRAKILVDYKNFYVNGKNIFKKKTSVWHDESFKHKISVKNDEIIEFKIDARQHIPFDKLMFLSVLILSFFFSYKFIHYISKFKIIEKNSRSDVLFVTLFLTLLFIPMFYISNEDTSAQENRMLEKYPAFLNENGINNQFGMQFNNWFNDRFGGREQIIEFYTNIMYNINKIYKNNKAYFFKDTGWIFSKVFQPQTPSKTKIQKIVQSIQQFDKFCKENNIKLYVLITPHKEMIYSDLLKNYGYNSKKEKKFQNYIQEVVVSFTDGKIVYPYNELLKGKQTDFVFFKQTHHWTDYGAFLGYEKLATHILKDFPNFEKVELNDYVISHSNYIRDDWDRKYHKGHTTNLLNLKNQPDEEILNTEYIYFNPKDKIKLTEERSKFIKDFKNSSVQNNYRLFLFGNSQNENLLQFITASVQQTKYLRLNKGQFSADESYKFMKHYKDEFLAYKPDFAIIALSAANLQFLSDLFKD